MTTRPPPAPLVVRPGRYRTRGGDVAVVTLYQEACYWPWRGSIGTMDACWTENGRSAFKSGVSNNDLIARLPSPKKPKPQPAPGKRRKVRADPTGYGVWVACSSRASAQGIADSLDANGYRCLTVMKLPIGRGRGGK